jgi:hypothetical protein
MRQRICPVLLLLATLAVAPALAPTHAAAAGGTVTIVLPDDGGERPLALADLAGAFDVADATYELRAADGTATEVAVPAGISLRALLEAADVELDSFTYLEVSRPDGTSVFVPHHQALATEAPPVAWEDEAGLHFLRSSTGEEDVNVDDLVSPADGALTLRLKTGPPLALRIDAAPRRVGLREPIAFTAVVLAGDRPGLTFEWYFYDGSIKGGKQVTHRYRRAGVFEVILNVYYAGTQLDPFAIVRVRVVGPRPRRERRERPPASTGGGAGTRADGTGTGTGAGLGRTGGATGTPSPTLPRTSSPPAPRPRRRAPRPRRDEAAPGRTLVSGTLLASTSATPLAAGAGRASRSAAAAGDGSLHIPIGVWVGLGVSCLLLLGWGLEARNTVPFWRSP